MKIYSLEESYQMINCVLRIILPSFGDNLSISNINELHNYVLDTQYW